MLLESLSSLSLPEAHMPLLQPSIQLGKVRKTGKQVLNEAQLQQSSLSKAKCPGKSISLPGDFSGLVGTTWGRKNRKRRRLKAEKLFLDPKPNSSMIQENSLLSSASEESEEEEGEEEEEKNKGGVVIDQKLGEESCVTATLPPLATGVCGVCVCVCVCVVQISVGGVGDRLVGCGGGGTLQGGWVGKGVSCMEKKSGCMFR